jgi:uncharacterized protein YkwD
MITARLFLLAVPMLSVEVASAQDAPFVRDLLQKHNAVRREQGLKPFRYNLLLSKAAQSHAEWMAVHRKMEHLQPQPTNLEDFRTCSHHPLNRVVRAGYLEWDDVFRVDMENGQQSVLPVEDANSLVGENIAEAKDAGHPAQQTRLMIDGWMKSPGHRHAILTPEFTEIGIGTACTNEPDYDTYWCVVFARPAEKASAK